jgi:D-alanyl-D-alanine carboxypeptidase
MYGMMLPSGNDAAFALAEFFGAMLKKRKYQNVMD